MKENAIYYGKHSFYQLIKNIGGAWNDTKERPIVCLLKLKECENIYWAVPIGNWEHRTEDAQKRINNYMALPKENIASCYYHVGRTTTKSIFFISDVVPITDKYIEREYLGKDSKGYIIKNPKLLEELQRKLKRIIYYEDKNPNYFRQHITDIKKYLLKEIKDETKSGEEIEGKLNNI